MTTKSTVKIKIYTNKRTQIRIRKSVPVLNFFFSRKKDFPQFTVNKNNPFSLEKRLLILIDIGKNLQFNFVASSNA